MDSFAPEAVAISALVAAAAGVIRGITGFGGAMVMSPPLALLLGPLVAVPVVSFLEFGAGLPQWVETRRLVQWRVIAPILAAACLTVPLGTYVLVSLDPQVMRRVIAAVVIVFALLLLLGWRYHGRPRVATSLGVGALAGGMVGATSMGGPPVILYLLAGSERIDITRANLTYLVGAFSLFTLVAMGFGGLVGREALWLAAAMTPGYYLGMVAGTRLFASFNDAKFRRFTLVFMMVVAGGILLV